MKVPARLKIYARSFKPNEFVYTTLCSRLKVRPRTILMESGHRRILMGNVLALFEALVDDDRFFNWEIIVSVSKELYGTVKEEYSQYSNVKVICSQSVQYAFYLSRVQFLINDNTFYPYFSRKTGQVYLNLWHGTPFKCMGFDEPDITAWKMGNALRNFIHCDYLLVTNEYSKELFDRAYRLSGVFNGTMLLGGYPRNDILVESAGDNEIVKTMRRKLELTEGKKVVMYAPTWRGRIGSPVSTEYSDKVTLAKLLNRHDDIILLYRGHPIVDSEATFSGRVIDVSTYKEINDLYICSDILITDYSSSFIDYSILGKPVLFYMYDEDLYREERGFYEEMYEQLPGPVCRSMVELSAALTKQLQATENEINGKVKTFKDKYCNFDNGKATEDIINQLFFRKNQVKEMSYKKTTPTRKKLLMYMGGWFTNGVTVSAINLLNNLDYTKYSVSLLMRPTAFYYPHNIKQIPEQVNLISTVGNMSMELLLQYALQLLNIPGVSRINPLESYKKEVRRLVGDNQYDAVINFCGYSPFFTSLLASVEHGKKIIYLHNNIKKEQELRFPRLKITMSLLDRYDVLVPVSESLGQVIAEDFPKQKQKLKVCENLMGWEKVLRWARETTQINVDKNCYNYITIGRHSPEKGHDRLLHAFKAVSERHKQARLYIVASHGLLEDTIKVLVKTLGLQDKVILTGPLDNPFPLLRQCDCFVLSSLYEGQGLVLLEAMALGVPVISTDVEGARSVVGDYGLLVESGIKGLTSGMDKAIENGLRKPDFDSEAYDRKAIEKFYSILEA